MKIIISLLIVINLFLIGFCIHLNSKVYKLEMYTEQFNPRVEKIKKVLKSHRSDIDDMGYKLDDIESQLLDLER
ncbi:MAG: hypothetical protein LC112_15295 [Flavobacteriales bacterium]|nr:hypothetical protein [Flavobacteriales bacterium]